MPTAEQVQARELMSTFDAQLKSADDQATKRDIIGKVVDVYVKTNGGLDATKDAGTWLQQTRDPCCDNVALTM